MSGNVVPATGNIQFLGTTNSVSSVLGLGSSNVQFSSLIGVEYNPSVSLAPTSTPVVYYSTPIRLRDFAGASKYLNSPQVPTMAITDSNAFTPTLSGGGFDTYFIRVSGFFAGGQHTLSDREVTSGNSISNVSFSPMTQYFISTFMSNVNNGRKSLLIPNPQAYFYVPPIDGLTVSSTYPTDTTGSFQITWTNTGYHTSYDIYVDDVYYTTTSQNVVNKPINSGNKITVVGKFQSFSSVPSRAIYYGVITSNTSLNVPSYGEYTFVLSGGKGGGDQGGNGMRIQYQVSVFSTFHVTIGPAASGTTGAGRGGNANGLAGGGGGGSMLAWTLNGTNYALVAGGGGGSGYSTEGSGAGGGGYTNPNSGAFDTNGYNVGTAYGGLQTGTQGTYNPGISQQGRAGGAGTQMNIPYGNPITPANLLIGLGGAGSIQIDGKCAGGAGGSGSPGGGGGGAALDNEGFFYGAGGAAGGSGLFTWTHPADQYGAYGVATTTLIAYPTQNSGSSSNGWVLYVSS